MTANRRLKSETIVENSSNDPTVLAGSDELTGKAVGRFQITALLGKGGMGEVYLAEDSLLKRPVALKRVAASLRSDMHYRELLIKEAERASRLNDPHVAHVHDVLEHEGEIFVVMEYVDGRSLRQRTGEPLPVSEFLPIAIQCVEALVAAHQSGIAHRDIKPENIMITPKGRVKVCDFGLARQGAWTEETAALDKTPTIAFRGTPAYMAPEALLNRDSDFRADMFSLGIVFYELLAGQHPFRDVANPIATADRIIHTDAPLLSTVNPLVPPALSDVVQKMLRKDAADRYQTPSELLLKLQNAVREPQTRQKQKWALVLALLIVVALSTTLLLLFRLPPSATAPYRNLVVLPIHAIDASGETYSEGLTETLVTALHQATLSSHLQVTPATEVRSRNVTTAEEARRQFSADIILSGTLNRTDSLTRMSYSLFESETLRQIKADTVTADSTDPFALERERETDRRCSESTGATFHGSRRKRIDPGPSSI